MKDNDIEIIDENSQTMVDNNESTNVVVPEINNIDMEPQVLDTKVDKKSLKQQEQKVEDNTTSNLEQTSSVTIVETSVTKGATGSEVIGNIQGESVIPTNNKLPDPIDITVKQKTDKSKVKKVKVVSKKDRIISIIVSLFVIIVLVGSGYAVYYFGYKTNPSRYTLKTIYLELGDKLPSTVSYYVQSTNQFDDMEYNLDISNVSQNTIGTYTYTVTHKNVSKVAQVIVRDTKAPVLTLKDKELLVFQKNSKVTKDSIVLFCEDLSNCTFKTEFDINTETPGEKEVNSIARDDVGNETKETVKIQIIDIQKTLVCTSSNVESEDKSYFTNNIYTLNFDGNDYLVKQSGVIQYTYNDYAAYFAKLEEIQNNTEYKINRTNFTYTKEIEVETNNLTSLSDLVNYYNDNGYTCK